MIEKPATNKKEESIDYATLAAHDTILAARCPAGWRRDPLTGRPVMPCLGRLLFPCAPHEVPTAAEIAGNCQDARLSGIVDELVCILLINAAMAKHRHGECLDLLDERVVSDVVDAALREHGTVRIRRTAGGWEEVPDAAAAGE